MGKQMNPDERVLEDSYPVYVGHFYIVDGEPTRSPITGSVRGLKVALEAKEIRRCDLRSRGML